MRDRARSTVGWRLRRGVVLGVVALLALLLSRPLGGQVLAVQAQAQSGSPQTFTTCVAHSAPPTITVPANTSVQLTVQGAAGPHGSDAGKSPGGDGGHGAFVQGTLTRTNQERQLTIYVGCAGTPAASSPGGLGYTNGGVGGFAHHAAGSGAGGGGSSAVLLEGIGPILVAGGGGGGGGGGTEDFSDTGGAGSDGGGVPEPGAPGGGDHGGAGGCSGCVAQEARNRAGRGGGTDDDGGGGGGGGGGYCVPGPSCHGEDGGGGGQGASADDGGGGGGGAGNSYVSPAPWLINVNVATSTLTGDGQVTVSWTPAALDGAAPGPEAPAQPMTVTGQVHHVVPPLVSEGQISATVIPHVGATVEALVGSTVCGTAVTDAAGRFTLTVATHPATPGCGQPGATVRFRVEGTEHLETVPFQSGGTAMVALRSSDTSGVPPTGWP